MNKTYSFILVLIVLLIINVESITRGIHKEDHKVTSQCCLSKGGKLCGTVVKDCCKDSCEAGILHS
jgi:hypothetical protein